VTHNCPSFHIGLVSLFFYPTTLNVVRQIIRDLLREAAENLNETSWSVASGGGLEAAGSVFDRAMAEESLLHRHHRSAAVPDLPETLITQSQVARAAAKQNEPEPDGPLLIF